MVVDRHLPAGRPPNLNSIRPVNVRFGYQSRHNASEAHEPVRATYIAKDYTDWNSEKVAMRPPNRPADEKQRLSTLHALGLLDTSPEERFDVITRTVAALYNAPIALISLVDSKRQWFKSRYGVAISETPREVSFCGHAILGSDILVVDDAQQDERFNDNPLVLGEPFVRFYAGRPLEASNGSRIGTLCIIDRESRSLSAEQRDLLQQLGAWVEAEIRLIEERQALPRYLDHLLELVADPVLLADGNGSVRFANSAALRLLRYEARDIFGRPLWTLLDAAERDSFEVELAALARVTDEFNSLSHSTTICCKDGTRLSVMLTFSRRNAAGQSIVAVLLRQF
ncbi:MAG: GAF domain-containing protein [Pseudomonadota bacterium]